MNQPQGESIWGTINTSIEIALNIYMIVAKDKDGNEHTGVMARKNTAAQSLSPNAVSMAQENGDWLCYDESTKDIPVYEVLQRRISACKRLESAALQEMEAIKRGSNISLTDYFGECAPPVNTPHGAIGQMSKIRNGIFLTQDSSNFMFAVHTAIADNYMSPIAAGFGHNQGDYLYYDITSSSIAINELKNIFDEIGALVVSEDSLNATLFKEFPHYTTQYNEIMQGEYKIPEVDAPVNLFLAVQLEKVKLDEQQNVSRQEAHEIQPVWEEPDFNEEACFEI